MGVEGLGFPSLGVSGLVRGLGLALDTSSRV